MARVRCATCHRREERSSEGVERVLAEGGGRRPAVHAQWARGQTALRAAAGELGPVVGVCSVCGQLLVLEDGHLPVMPVRIDTPAGALLLDGTSIRGPDGLLDREAAEAFLRTQYEGVDPEPGEPTSRFGTVLLLLAVAGPLALWIAALVFVWSFLAGFVEGGPAAGPGGLLMPRP